MSEATLTSVAAPPTAGLPAPLARALDRVRSRWLAVRVGEFPVLVLATLALAWLVQAAADRFLHLEWRTRLILLSVDLAAVLALLAVFVVRPWLARLNREQAALLIERELPHFRTGLISAVELGSPNATVPPSSRALVRRLVENMAQEMAREDVAPRVIHAARLRRFFWIMAAALALAVAGFFWARPLSPLLLRRILLSEIPFPPETEVIAESADFDLLAGADAPLAAQAVGLLPSSGRLVVKYGDGRLETITLSPTGGQPSRFAFTVKNVRQPFSYRFELNDGAGAEHRVAVRFPPSIKELRFTQIYPKYTQLKEAVMSPANLRLLEGSQLRIEVMPSTELRSAVLEIKGPEEIPAVTLTAPATPALKKRDKGKPAAPEKTDGTLQTELTIPGTGWKSFNIHLTDTAGEPSVNDPTYRVELMVDQPPLVAFTAPKKESITVLPTAKIPVALKASDDFGLRKLTLRYRVSRPAVGGALEGAEEGQFPFEIPAGEKSVSQTMTWDLSRLVPPVPVGCSITAWVEAEDTHTPGVGKPGVISRSAEKNLVIVSEEQKRQELIEQLGERARDLERLYENQRNMNETTDNSLK